MPEFPEPLPSGAVASTPPTRRPTALVVDDDALFLEIAASLLREEGYEPVFAASADEAIGWLRSPGREAQLVLSDIVMPGKNGFAVVEAARALPNAPAIVLVTGLSESDDLLFRARAQGIPTVTKPVDAGELGRAVAWAMHGRRLEAQGLRPMQLHVLYRMATEGTTGLTLAETLDRVLSTCIGALGGDSGSFMLSEPAGETMTVGASYRLEGADRVGVPVASAVARWVAQKQVPLHLVGPLDNYPQFKGLPSKASVAESLVAPLVFRNQVFGAVCINSSRAGRLDKEQLAMLVAAADIAAAAIHRDRAERVREHQDRLAMLGQMSASLAHELNNPLACLRANLGAMRSLTEPPGPTRPGEAEEILRDAEEAVERMITLVASLKGVTRKPGHPTQPIALEPLLQRAAVLVRPQLKHHVKLKIEAAPTLPVLADSGRILQILVNLVMNAGQAIEGSGNVVLRAWASDDRVVVEVQDDGPGIPREVADHLFEPFFTTKPEGVGTGLGLTISRQIARDHGGDLTFVSEPGKGSCFTLALPAAITKASGAPVLLLVDDEPILLRAFTRMFREAFEVLTAENGPAALALAAGRNIDLVISDYAMPGMDGLELIHTLRDRGVRAPCALITGNPEVGAIDDAVRSGLVTKVFPKPSHLGTLLAEARAMVKG